MNRLSLFFLAGSLLALGTQAPAQAGPPAVALEAGQVDLDPNLVGAITGTFQVSLLKAGIKTYSEEDVRIVQEHERMRGDKGSEAARDFQAVPIRLRWHLRKQAKAKPALFSVEAIETHNGKRLFIELLETNATNPGETLIFEKGLDKVAGRLAARLATVQPSKSDTQRPTSPLPKLPPAELDTRVACGQSQLAPLEELGRYYLDAVNVMERNRDAGCEQVLAAAQDYRRQNTKTIEQTRAKLVGTMEPLKPFLACKDQILGRAAGTMLGIYARCKPQRKDIVLTVSTILELQVVDHIKR